MACCTPAKAWAQTAHGLPARAGELGTPRQYSELYELQSEWFDDDVLASQGTHVLNVVSNHWHERHE